jgi:hypothetical protein
MFNPYPIEATTNNWLHEAVIEIIKIIHTRLDNGSSIVTTVNKQQHWLALLPANVDIRLKRWTGVRNRVLDYARFLKRPNLSQAQR